MPSRNARFVLPVAVVVSGALALAGCSVTQPDDVASPQESAPSVAVREIEQHALLLDTADPVELALTASQTVYARAETVVLADAADDEAMASLAAAAVGVRAPALLARGGSSDTGLRDELNRLGARVAVVVGEEGAAAQDVASAAGVQVVRATPDVVEGEDGFPVIEDDDLGALLADVVGAGGTAPSAQDAPRLLREVLAVVDPEPGQEAAIASLRAVGAVAADVPGGDLGAARAVRTVDEAQALTVLGVGPTFGEPEDFAWRVAAAEGGALLPSGTQHLLPGRYVTTSADRWDDPATMVARAQEVAAVYDVAPAGDEAADADETAEGGEGSAQEAGPVVPTLRIAAGEPATAAGDDGDWVTEEDPEALRPLVDAAREAGVYVLLDVGSGTAPLVEEVREVEALLQQSGVGVAVHPERRLSDDPASSHRADAAEVQDVVTYLADLMTREGLPPTMLVVHQTRPDSVPDRQELRSVAQVEVVVAADRTGGGTTGEWVWNEVSAGVPDGVHLGWSGPGFPTSSAPGLVPTDPSPVVVGAL
ncbi:hypothetical protein LEP48_06160 [Isoptericola sp. NEAU-Y5]|uniref:Lipoprotein n=1 Tax=Isoptericola luteus TaxID=2879484 RepID=A0ABS7ZD08_9MICO|nr:hypothetical protein [Isoptericola sp. NEAU-Y5]MCA5892938.1 hypothetical protein [Isoptericola sp. NEAU-Y5]